MRVSTAFNRLLKIPGASVSAVSITDTDVEVELRLRARRLECPCGHTSPATYDRSTRRWRHLDLGTHRLWLVYEIRRIHCPHCGVRTEHVPWAWPTARHTRDFEDTVLWLAARTDRTSVSTLMRCAWETVTAIINRTVDELLDTRRLERLYRIGVDEICYRHPHKYLTVIGDHDTKTVVHIEPGRSTESLAAFYEQQHESDLDSIEAVSMDGSKAYRVATEEHVPNARICFDPFHVMQWVNRALDRVFADASSANRRRIELSSGSWRKVRIALRTGAERLTDQRRALLDTLTSGSAGRARMATERANAGLVPRRQTLTRQTASTHMDRRRRTQRNPRIHNARPTDRQALRRNHRRSRTRHLQRTHRRYQLKNPTDQRSRLRAPLRRIADLDDLPEPRRNRPQTTHTKVRSAT